MTTPMKDPICTSMSFQSEDGGLSSSDDTSMFDETSSVLSSPPRSVRLSSESSGSRTTSRFSSRQHGRPDPSHRHTLNNNNNNEDSHCDNKRLESPKVRRLFDEPSSGDEETLQRLSPPRRTTLRQLDLNHHLMFSDTAEPSAPPVLGSRKRSSAERRGDVLTPRLDTSSDSGDQAMYSSPLTGISPNSFVTMDGRFVQSRNPFSSPMMTDEEQTPQQSRMSAGGPGPYNHGTAAPSLPVNVNDSSTAGGLLPPRHHHERQFPPNGSGMSTATAAMSGFAGNTTGYPDHRYSFTGSPIQEDFMETSDTASGGSLHKVRRFRRSDDVCAASGQLFSSARRRDLSVDTAMEGSAMSSDGKDLFSDDVSPTDVLSFPPPTPVKSRPSRQPYSAIRRQTPATPRLERRRNLQAPPTRTPHPGSFLQESSRGATSANAHEPQQPKSRFYEDFDIIGELGKGSFGTVYRVLSRLDGCMYAIKAAQRKAKGIADRHRMLKEVYALAALSDRADQATFHIVRYHQAWMEDDRLYIQTELCTGTLADEIASGSLTEHRRFKVLREILVALEFLHRQCMVHLDIKPENIFLKNDQYKLGDFGLVTRASSDQDVDEGDSRYMSLELLMGDRSDLTKSDIFSLGVTMYEICLGRPLPMNGPEWQDIRHGRLIMPLPNTPHELSTIVRQMMGPVPAHRPTASQLLQHPQLLSDEQKALKLEKTRVMQANMQLAQHAFSKMCPPPTKRALTRANTWNGSSNL